jgi:hypothetical protein
LLFYRPPSYLVCCASTNRAAAQNITLRRSCSYPPFFWPM